MALDKFRAPTLPAPPKEYSAEHIRQMIRALEVYFNQLDSNTPNHAEKYTADRFVGGVFAGTSRSITVTNSASISDYLILADATAGNITVALPAAASSSGTTLVVKKTDVSVNTVTLDGNGAETIDGVTTKVLSAQYASLMIFCNGTAWWII